MKLCNVCSHNIGPVCVSSSSSELFSLERSENPIVHYLSSTEHLVCWIWKWATVCIHHNNSPYVRCCVYSLLHRPQVAKINPSIDAALDIKFSKTSGTLCILAASTEPLLLWAPNLVKLLWMLSEMEVY